DRTLPGSNAADAAEARTATQNLLLQQQALFAVLVLHQLGRALAIGGIHVIVPEREWLQHVSVGIDHLVVAVHACSLQRRRMTFHGRMWNKFPRRPHSVRNADLSRG